MNLSRLIPLLIGMVGLPLCPVYAAPVTYRITPGPGQSIRFEARTNTERYAGQTDQVSGEVRVNPENIVSKPIAIFTVHTAGFSTGNGTRDSNMRRKHLAVDTFPIASFALTALDVPGTGMVPALTEGKSVAGTLHGTLTLHGVTKLIVPSVIVTRERDAATGHDSLHIVARFVVRLRDYGIPTPRILFLETKQEHPIIVDLHAIATP